MFQDPNHPDLQQLANHHDAGTHDAIPADQAAAAVQDFHQQADPQLMREVTDQHYDQMPPAQLQAAAQEMKNKLATVADSSAEAARLAQIDPATATPLQVAEMHRFMVKNHPDLMRDVLIAGGAIAVGALAAFAARRYLRSHGR